MSNETLQFERIAVGARLPKLLQPVMVETLQKTRYIACRFEVGDRIYDWGLTFRGKIIGRVENVAFWFEEV